MTPFYAIFQPYLASIWQCVSIAGGTNCSWEWTSNIPLATDNYFSWDSNPNHSEEGRIVSNGTIRIILLWLKGC